MEEFDVMTAPNGESAMKLLADSKKKPALIFLDILMPDMDGVEFRRRQIELPEIRDIPTVVLTCGDAKPDLIHEMAPAAWLQKPVNVDEIIQLARQAGAKVEQL